MREHANYENIIRMYKCIKIHVAPREGGDYRGGSSHKKTGGEFLCRVGGVYAKIILKQKYFLMLLNKNISE